MQKSIFLNSLSRITSFLLVAAAFPVLAAAQIPENIDYKDIDVVYLNRKLKEIESKRLIEKWSLSKDGDALTIEMSDDWYSMTKQVRAELSRRLLSIFAYYISNRDARQWNFSVILERQGKKLAEDRGVWWQKDKPPEVYE